MNRNRLQLGIGLAIAAVATLSYYSRTQTNTITGDKQHIQLTPGQEVALGLQAAPEMSLQYGGDIESGEVAAYMEAVGQRVVSQSDAAKTPYRFKFHVLRDDRTVNAFALPGGQVFITVGLLR